MNSNIDRVMAKRVIKFKITGIINWQNNFGQYLDITYYNGKY